MSTKRFVSLILAATVMAVIGGCGKTPEVASPDCAELDKTIDPAKRTELLKKCPRSGPAFRPSPIKSY